MQVVVVEVALNSWQGVHAGVVDKLAGFLVVVVVDGLPVVVVVVVLLGAFEVVVEPFGLGEVLPAVLEEPSGGNSPLVPRAAPPTPAKPDREPPWTAVASRLLVSVMILTSLSLTFGPFVLVVVLVVLESPVVAPSISLLAS